MSGDFPFLFYGSRPDDWYEGANLGHCYEIRFREPPAPDVRTHLGRTWDESTALGAVVAGPWLWCGRWALLRVGERHVGRFDAFFRKMTDLLEAVNDIAPIAEAVFWGARAGTPGEWEEWTLAEQATPSAGPVYPQLAPESWYRQPRDAALGTPAPDADFDRGRTEAGPAPPPPLADEPTEVDDSEPADLDAAVARAEAFLEKYTSRDEYYEDGEWRVMVQYVAKNQPDDGVSVLFSCQSSADVGDPELEALCAKAVAALERNQPNLGFTIEWELSD